jgi:acetyl/propionyl-CoA carboxylase alpha subunit
LQGLKEKVLIANRGEIAIRIARACEDLGLDYVMIYTEADKESEHVYPFLQNQGAGKRAWKVSSYTDPNDIISVADHTGCTAIHPGYGFFSEDFRFARRVTIRERPITFIGPKWEVIRDLGDKINTKRVANKLGIPTIPGTDGPIYNEMEAEDIADQLLEEQRAQKIKNPSILV